MEKNCSGQVFDETRNTLLQGTNDVSKTVENSVSIVRQSDSDLHTKMLPVSRDVFKSERKTVLEDSAKSLSRVISKMAVANERLNGTIAKGRVAHYVRDSWTASFGFAGNKCHGKNIEKGSWSQYSIPASRYQWSSWKRS
mmetsp:Transcript_6361/g.9243  ORF Transcript_6361/g.9243 Transcript_6361/m.9243 type:complete len:140 (-) Transcript_6361:429-848(-)